MKIRAGFVSNSSSTSFLLIAKEDLNREDFFELMGIATDSPVVKLFDSFYDSVVENTLQKIDFGTRDSRVPACQWFADYENEMSPVMNQKIEEAKARGLKVYFGLLDSETSMIQTFFCTDSFELENEKIYFNGLECVW